MHFLLSKLSEHLQWVDLDEEEEKEERGGGGGGGGVGPSSHMTHTDLVPHLK